jgi:LysR family glycine cleavage system transcriptional activator
VHISVTPTLATKWLIPNLNAFGTAHPAIDLRVVATERVSSFHTDKIDLAKIHDTHDLWPAFLRLMGLPPTHSRGLRLNQTALAIDAAIAGQGIALASRFLVRHALNAGTLVQIGQTSLHTGDDYYLLSQRGATQRPAIKATAQWLQALGTSADRTTG